LETTNEDIRDIESALALLYMEINNNDGAVIQLSRIANDAFESHFFEFIIDTQKLLFFKQHPQASKPKY